MPAEEEGEPIELQVADVAAELAAAQEGVTADGGGTYFYVHVLGGSWTKLNKGVSADGTGGFAREGIAVEWCDRHAFPKQASRMFSKYGLRTPPRWHDNITEELDGSSRSGSAKRATSSTRRNTSAHMSRQTSV